MSVSRSPNWPSSMAEIALEALTPQDAAAAAAIHIEGQPGTFLTRLGPAFLGAMYRGLAAAPDCYGFVARHDGQAVGVVAAMPAGQGLLGHMGWRGVAGLFLPLAGALLRDPALIKGMLQTMRYGQAFDTHKDEVELLFIGVQKRASGEGIGRALIEVLAEASRRRGMRWMSLIVDDGNERAKRFYQRNGLRPEGSTELHGRTMYRYLMDLRCEEVA